MNLTDFKEAEAVMKILDHSDLDVPYCVPAVTMAESVSLSPISISSVETVSFSFEKSLDFGKIPS